MCVKGNKMSLLNAISNVNTQNRNRFSEFNTSRSIVNFQTQGYSYKPEKECNRAGVCLTTLLGVGSALAFISKKQGFSLNPAKIKNTPVKDWAIFKIYNKNKPFAKTLELEEPEILTLAGGSVAGGLAGGLMFDDKRHRKAKMREAVNQMLGNVLVPVLCVGGASRLFAKHEDTIMKYVPQIRFNPLKTGLKLLNKFSAKNAIKIADVMTKTVKYTNKFLNILPVVGTTAVALATGIIAGNKVSNFLNEKVFHKKVERKIQKTDFAPHVDDLSMAITLMADKSPVSSIIARTIPAFLCIPGLEVGNHR